MNLMTTTTKGNVRIIFMGTPDFAVPVFYALVNAGHDVRAVLTQPDRPKGRGHSLAYSPVKAAALAKGVPVLQPEKLRGTKEMRETLKSYNADMFVVAAYGLILPQRILDMPPLGCVNVHASLLPKDRGASPIHSALLNGDTTTGVTIMYMAAGIDTGDMILKRELSIAPDERFPSLHDRMAAFGGECITEAVALIAAGKAARTPQNDEDASYAPMISKEDGHIDWTWPSQRIINLTRALDPWPGPYTLIEDKPLTRWRCEVYAGQYIDTAAPGDILYADTTRGLVIRTADGAVCVTELQAVGGKRLNAKDYLRGHKILI
jgi:methionyl-tRNA formyltransferase